MKHLKTFKPSELIFNEEETREILSFFFTNLKGQISNIRINNDVRGFAQALLVEAIDTSYAMGFVESLFRSVMKPSNSVLKVIRKFAVQAGKHWFEHATTKDLRDIEIYYIVRQRLQANFKTVMLLIINELDFKSMISVLPKPSLSQYA